MSPEEQRIRKRLRSDFPYYASRCLKIRTKAGPVIPLVLNSVQREIHRQIEEQRQRLGMVRVILLKCRQPGASTYVGGRYYWRVTHAHGLRVFILTHKDEATNNLFAMVKRFHDQCPPAVRPATNVFNAKELDFGALDSSYRVGTAKAAGVGRSDTIQLFHGSEVAHWPQAEKHAQGVLQAVPREKGTEIILESTANGLGGLFYSMAKQAERGEGDYILIFIAWFMHAEYRAEPPTGWRAPPEFEEYERLHELDREQTYWAFLKNGELATANAAPTDAIYWQFRQEYPATAQEAFQATAEGAFVRSELVVMARAAQLDRNENAPLIFGLDVAAGGGDETVLMCRQARVAGHYMRNGEQFAIFERWNINDQMEIAGKVARIMDEHDPEAVFIDVGGGYGSGVYDRLVELEYGEKVHPVQFGSSPYDPERYANKRAEMWGLMRDWLGEPGGADVPDDDLLHTHICAPQFKLNSNDQIVLEDKAKIKARLQLSPDIGDALALTFAEPVRQRQQRRVRSIKDLPPTHPAHGIV